MAGGPSTPGLVAAAAEAGGLGFLTAGYKQATDVEADIAEVQTSTTKPFGINVFVPGAPTPDPHRLNDYLDGLAAEAAALGVELGSAVWDDDQWDAKVGLVLEVAPAVVSFTFGLPPQRVVTDLQRRGSKVLATVTSVDEARAAASLEVDGLCVQGMEAGAHRGSFVDDPLHEAGLPLLELLSAVRATVDVPLLAAGGIARPSDVRAALDAGALAVQVGTAFLRCDESGAHPLHQAALVDPSFKATATTRSFSGRTARGLVNRFMTEHPDAPVAYPEINNATRPLRSAFAAAGDPSGMSLWAGTGHRRTHAGTAASVMDWLGSELP